MISIFSVLYVFLRSTESHDKRSQVTGGSASLPLASVNSLHLATNMSFMVPIEFFAKRFFTDFLQMSAVFSSNQKITFKKYRDVVVDLNMDSILLWSQAISLHSTNFGWQSVYSKYLSRTQPFSDKKWLGWKTWYPEWSLSLVQDPNNSTESYFYAGFRFAE